MSNSLISKIQQGAVRRVHFLGDSITQGCGFVSQQQAYPYQLMLQINRLAGKLDVHSYNHAVGGATSTDGMDRVNWSKREDHLPDLAFIMFGLNDVNQGVSIDDYAANLRGMIDHLREVRAAVVLLGPTPFVGREDDLAGYNQRAHEVARQAEIPFIECLDPFYESGNLRADMLWSDDLHLTALGQQLLAQTVWDGLQQVDC